jgi:hypothetical protein
MAVHTAAFWHAGSHLELMSHVALGRWRQLAADLRDVSTGAARPETRLIKLGTAYRHFSVNNPQHFRLTYQAEIWRAIELHTKLGGGDGPVTLGADGLRFRDAAVLREIHGTRDEAFGSFESAAREALSSPTGATNRRVGTRRSSKRVERIARAVASLSHALAMEALDEQLGDDEVGPVISLVVKKLIEVR